MKRHIISHRYVYTLEVGETFEGFYKSSNMTVHTFHTPKGKRNIVVHPDLDRYMDNIKSGTMVRIVRNKDIMIPKIGKLITFKVYVDTGE